MLENLPKFHTLDIEYNGFGPFTAVSSERSGIVAHIATEVRAKAIELYVNIRIDKNTTKHYSLGLDPGDRLKFTYDGPNLDHGSSIDKIEEHARPLRDLQLRDGFRVGFDIIDGEKKSRLSHPEGGGFNITMDQRSARPCTSLYVCRK